MSIAPKFICTSLVFFTGVVQGDTIRDCDVCPDLVVIAAGEFMMGTSAGGYEAVEDTGEAPQVAIHIVSGFAMSATEITVAQFEAFATASDLPAVADCRAWQSGRWTVRSGVGWHTGDGTMPVACVTWSEANAYAQWLSQKTGFDYRLPSEAEWEYAARAGTSSPRYWGWNSFEGVSISDACEHANVFDIAAQSEIEFPWPNARCNDTNVRRAKVASYIPNSWGLYDMIGNVWEWTADCYTRGYWNRPRDGRAWKWDGGCKDKVMRGGAWSSRPLASRATNRGRAAGDFRGSDLGFRVVRELVDVSDDSTRQED